MNTNAVLVAVGWLTLLYYAIIVVRFFFVAFYTSPSSLLKRYRRSPNDTWAAVTGASDGIGFGVSDAPGLDLSAFAQKGPHSKGYLANLLLA